MSEAFYALFSKLEGDPNVGVDIATAPPGAPQPVRLDVSPISRWIARPDIFVGGPTRLGVGQYPFTYESDGTVFATINPGAARDWFLLPGNGPPGPEQVWRIGADPMGDSVWTVADEPGSVVQIKPMRPGDPHQVFKFVPILRD